MSLAVDELEARRRRAGGGRVAALAERLLDPRAVVEPGHDVEVVVRSRLLPEQRVDRPAAVEPDLDAASLQVREQVEDAWLRPSPPAAVSRVRSFAHSSRLNRTLQGKQARS